MAEKGIVTVLKNKRAQLRTAVTKLIKLIDEEIEKDNVNYEVELQNCINGRKVKDNYLVSGGAPVWEEIITRERAATSRS
ncbi:hypothetical protein TNCV_445581 [Trichonephila clavipes]|nr:hypothetical protein TNCV_445581 [Trichonephila clavipes]